MTPPLHHLVQALTLLAAVVLTAQASAATRRLQSIQTVASKGNQVALSLQFSGPAPSPSVFTVQEPAQLSIDLPDTALDLDKRYREIGEGAVQSINAAAAHGKTRVVIKLTQLVNYHMQRQGNQLIVRLGGSADTGASTGSTASSAGHAHAAGGQQASAIQNIDFRRGQQGAGRVKITLNGSNAPLNITREGNRIVAKLPGVHLPSRLAQRLDVTDFATPVKTVDARATAHGTRLVVTPVKNAEFQRLAYQTGHHLYIELQPLTPAQKEQKNKAHPEYKGKKISLSFQDISIRSVLQIIAQVAHVNMVVADSVSGKIALQLDDVPWDQALDIILNAKGLGMTRQNNVITVAPLSEIISRAKKKAQARAASSDLAPLHSTIIQINYAKASDIAHILRSDSGGSSGSGGGANSANVGADQQALLSPRGRVTVDKRTNSLLLTDTRERLDQIRSLINRLDVPVRQVLIQSRIVVANRDFTRNLGVSQTAINGGKKALNNALSSGYSYGASDQGYTISLPADSATSMLATSIISDTFSLNLKLSAMESENDGEVISSPRVITSDGQEANIEQGREIPYQSGTVGSNAGTSVQFKKAVLSLNVTPKITPNKKVIMDLKVTQDSVGQYVPTSQGGSVPSIDTRSLTTQVLVNNGDTVVLGGVFEQNNTDKTGGVPYLRKIPLLGDLFKNVSHDHTKRELLIFVTPRIMNSSLSVGQQ